MSEYSHISVLGPEAVHYLAPRPGGTYCDCTLGGGGHTEAILEASEPDGFVIGIDRDPAAIDAATRRLERFRDRVALIHHTFGDVAGALAEVARTPVDGFVVDLGPSSVQFDRPERGFSFSHAGPIDMRMDPTQDLTALDLLRESGTDRLTAILRDYGEERYAPRIASRIKEALHEGRLRDTAELAELVANAIPAKSRRTMRIHPATRTFQALRIAVNGELDQLSQFLAGFPELLAPGGRCVIISFHSLEDRLVKRRFRELAHTSSLPPEYAALAGEPIHPTCLVLTRKPVMPGPDEIDRNPRARSARLRACEKVPSA